MYLTLYMITVSIIYIDGNVGEYNILLGIENNTVIHTW